MMSVPHSLVLATYLGVQYDDCKRIIQRIIRTAEVEYYEKLSRESRSNIIKSEKIVRAVINKRKFSTKTVAVYTWHYRSTKDCRKVWWILFKYWAYICQSNPSRQVWSYDLYQEWYYESWWRYQMETFSALLTLCAGNSSVTDEFPSQRPVTRSFDAFFDLHWTNGWVNNGQAGDLGRYRAVTVMILFTCVLLMRRGSLTY